MEHHRTCRTNKSNPWWPCLSTNSNHIRCCQHPGAKPCSTPPDALWSHTLKGQSRPVAQGELKTQVVELLWLVSAKLLVSVVHLLRMTYLWVTILKSLHFHMQLHIKAIKSFRGENLKHSFWVWMCTAWIKIIINESCNMALAKANIKHMTSTYLKLHSWYVINVLAGFFLFYFHAGCCWFIFRAFYSVQLSLSSSVHSAHTDQLAEI